MTKIDVALLDKLRLQMDKVGDALSTEYLDRGATDLFRAAHAAHHPGAEDTDPAVRAYLAEHPPLPAWADRHRMANGCAFFAEWGVELGLGLFLASLPLAYASHDGAQVLALTAQLESNTKRRVLESAQFVLDVTTPGALEPGESAYMTIRRVRLMHAGVRHLILNDPRIAQTNDPSVWPRWQEDWDKPINQEHLLGAMLSFSSSLMHVLDRLHATYDEQAAADYCHLWNVVGSLLGIDEALLPIERPEMDALEVTIRARTERPSDAGTELTAAVLDVVRGYIKIFGLRGLAVSMMRAFIGNHTADLLQAPRNNWTRVLVGAMRDMTQRMSLHLAHDRAVRRVVAWVSRRVLTGFVKHERGGQRPPFSIPDHLSHLWPEATRT